MAPWIDVAAQASRDSLSPGYEGNTLPWMSLSGLELDVLGYESITLKPEKWSW